MPADIAVRTALENLSSELAKRGVEVGRDGPLIPDPAQSGRLYMGLLMAALSERWPQQQYEQAQAVAAALDPDDNSLAAESRRGPVMSHRDWALADVARIRLQQQWGELFREWDVVLCPAMPTPAFAHDHSSPLPARRIQIDGKDYPYFDQMVWPGIATLPGLPATAAPIALSPTGLPIGVQIIGPYLEDRTPIAFAALMEREFGSFVSPPGYGG